MYLNNIFVIRITFFESYLSMSFRIYIFPIIHKKLVSKFVRIYMILKIQLLSDSILESNLNLLTIFSKKNNQNSEKAFTYSQKSSQKVHYQSLNFLNRENAYLKVNCQLLINRIWYHLQKQPSLLIQQPMSDSILEIEDSRIKKIETETNNPQKHKQSKLSIFLASLSQQCIQMIQNYLAAHQIPKTEQQKWDKIKLYHDLFIICEFKKNEQSIINRKKSVKDVCKTIHKTLTKLSQVTIKQRIQKKLANVSVKDIMAHISGDIDFSFDSKRKLINCNSLKSYKRQRTPEKSEFDFSESAASRSNHKITQFLKVEANTPKNFKKNKKIEEAHSKTTKSTCQYQGKSFKTVIARVSKNQEVTSEEPRQNGHQEDVENDFLNFSEHSSDEQQLIKPEPASAEDLEEIKSKMAIFSKKSRSKFQEYKKKAVEIFSLFQDLRSQKKNQDQNKIIQIKQQIQEEDKPTQIKKEKRISSCKKAMKKIEEQVQTLQSLFPRPLIETQDIPYIENPPKKQPSSENSQFFSKIFKRQSSPNYENSSNINENSQKENLRIDDITQKQLQFVFDLNNPQNKNVLSQNTLHFDSQNRSSDNSTGNTQDNIDRLVNLYNINEKGDKTQIIRNEEFEKTEEYTEQVQPSDESGQQRWSRSQSKQLKKAIVENDLAKLQFLKKKKSLESIILQGNSLGCEIEGKLLQKLEEEDS